MLSRGASRTFVESGFRKARRTPVSEQNAIDSFSLFTYYEAKFSCGMTEKEQRVVISNRKARHDYFILDTLEAGLVLKGTEVKSLRAGNANLQDSHALVKNGEV